ncbi:AMP-binding protein [Nesterenkonia sphaerica]|uniref:Acyl-CoA synthetase n=1 Tax=Nesterenkonia sphaerica TaxID=1804988 RepID=A0A5R9AKK9_9MICC|nr:AMP-binding protein [Nesterenkonia sphaerica]TLP79342.1 acyl-CoA synthetase [Nesterenkonia sphaerica]
MHANFEPLTPLSFLGRSASVFPEREAIIYRSRRLTYREFGEEVQRQAKAIHKHIEVGDVVTVVAPNVPEMLIAHFAVPLAGGVLSPLNPRLAPGEFEYILQHSESRLVLVDVEVTEKIASVVEGMPSPPTVVEVVDRQAGFEGTSDTSVVDYSEFLESGAGAPDFRWGVQDEAAPITLNYTSGTTGAPKGAVYSHRGAHLSSLGEVIHNGYDASTRYLATLPMFHCNGWCTPWAVTAAGGTHLCLRAVRADAIWEAFRREQVSHLCGAPVVCATIVDAEEADPVEQEIRMTTAGAAPPPSIIEKLEALNITPVHVYGLTEVYGPFTICEPQEAWEDHEPRNRALLMARQGVPMIHAGETRVVDELMNDLPSDGETLGEVVLRGNGVMTGYFKNPEATEEAFRGGWYHTGDLGVMHPDGYVELKDRAKDIIISGGENISSIELEKTLQAHPGVSDVAVVGVQHEKWGERPVAYVVVRAGSEVSEESLRAHCGERLAKFKVPDRIEFVEELPRTATGKIRKHTLRAGK